MNIQAIARLFVMVVSAGLHACSDDIGVLTRTFAVTAAPVDGGAADEPTCIFVPVLLGSRVEARHTIEETLAAMVSATREEIQIQFEGASPPVPTRTIPVVVLAGGYTEQLDVTSLTGERFRARFGSPCGAP
jgi:hypothetical protein